MSVREMETKLNGVLNRHKDANPTQLMNHNRLGFKPEDKKAVDQHAQSGGDKHEGFAKQVVTKGPHMIQELHTAAKDVKELKGFAEDLAKTFHL